MAPPKLEPILTYEIDLSLPGSRRLKHVIDAETETAKKLYANAKAELGEIPELVVDGFGILYRDYDGPYCAELEAWAKAAGCSFGALAVINCSYELDHLEHRWSIPDVLGKLIWGCTTGLRNVEGLGMVHIRTLDWPIPAMGSATRLLHFRTKHHDFVAVGFPAFVGVLSGMVPGQYSVSINWAPPSDMPDFHRGPSFLIRKTLEECSSYEQAVHRLCHTQLSTSAFFTVCGTKPSEACVIERTGQKFVMRQLQANGLEAQSNHYVSAEFEACNQALKAYASDPLIKTTKARRAQMLELLAKSPAQAGELSELMDTMVLPPVNNEETVQRIIFCPAKGELCLDRQTSLAKSTQEWVRSTWRSEGMA